MTKKDFELIASLLNYPKSIRITKEGLALNFAEKLAETNPRFNKEKFLLACGVKIKKDVWVCPKGCEYNYGDEPKCKH